MLTPTPMLSPSPMDIGSLFTATFEALKRRPGLFVLVALLPMIVAAVAIVAGVVVMIGAIASAVNRQVEAATGLVLLGVVLFGILGIALALLQLKSYGMLSLAAYEVAQGRQPTLSSLFSGTRGFLPRLAPVIAIAVGVVVAAYVAFFAAVFGLIAAATRGRQSMESGMSGLFAVFGLMMLFAVLLIPLGIFLNTRLLYTLPAVAIEERGGIDGLKRSWQLTRGSFWRTLGYYLLIQLAVYAIGMVVSMVSQVLTVPLSAGLGGLSRDSNPSPAALLAYLGAMVPLLIVLTVLQLAVSAFMVPLVQIYVTYMFIDQVRRSELPAAPAYPGGYYAPPGQFYGQGQYPSGQPQYPQHGYPSQGYPQAGPQYPQQGYPQQWPGPPPQGPQG